MILEQIIEETDRIASTAVTVFHTSKKPSIKMNAYLQRIAKYCCCSEAAYVLSLIYLDRV